MMGDGRWVTDHPSPSSLDVVPPDFLEAIVPGRQDVEVLDVRRRRRAPGRVVEEDERGIVKVDALDLVVHLLALVRIELPFRVLDQLFYLVILVARPDRLSATLAVDGKGRQLVGIDDVGGVVRLGGIEIQPMHAFRRDTRLNLGDRYRAADLRQRGRHELADLRGYSIANGVQELKLEAVLARRLGHELLRLL